MVRGSEADFIDREKGSRLLQKWRSDLGISQAEAASQLELDPELYSEFESGCRDLPFEVFLSCKAVKRGMKVRTCSLPRDRWVTTVKHMKHYLAGDEVVGELIIERRWQELRDFMDLVRYGPEEELAMTDPALFIMLRKAGTKAYLSGLMMFRGPRPELLNENNTPDIDAKYSPK